MTTTEDECIEALREAADRLGESPTKAAYEELELQPAASTILRVMGSWNEAKEAAGLETYEQGENGGMEVEPKPDWVELPDDETWEGLSPQQQWYYKNREYRIELKDQRRQELRRWFYEVKRDELECRRCGEGCPPCLDFHHPGEKDLDVSRMVNHGYGKEQIQREIENCVVLCANCHRKEHYEVSDRAETPKVNRSDTDTEAKDSRKAEIRRRCRAWIAEYKRESEGCSRCDTSNPVCLDFHHISDKTLGIAQMVSRGRPLAAIQAEVGNCELLCANCHREEHFEPPICSE